MTRYCASSLLFNIEYLSRTGFVSSKTLIVVENFDHPILAKIYCIDDMGKHSRGNLYHRYREWLCTSKSSGEEQGRGGPASLEQWRLNVLCEIDQESGRLRRYQQVRASLETMGTPPECTRHPDTRSSAPLRGQPRSLFRPNANPTRTPPTDAVGPSGLAQTRSATLDLLRIKLIAWLLTERPSACGFEPHLLHQHILPFQVDGEVLS